MQRIAYWFIFVLMPFSGGCAATANNILFELLQGAYTAESDDIVSRRAHFQTQVEAWERHERLGP